MTELLYECSNIVSKELSNETQVLNFFESTKNLSEHKEPTNNAQENIKATKKEDITMNKEIESESITKILTKEEEGKATRQTTRLHVQ